MQAIQYWPEGWDYWALGIPPQLIDYIKGGFQGDMKSWVKNKKIKVSRLES